MGLVRHTVRTPSRAAHRTSHRTEGRAAPMRRKQDTSWCLPGPGSYSVRKSTRSALRAAAGLREVAGLVAFARTRGHRLGAARVPSAARHSCPEAARRAGRAELKPGADCSRAARIAASSWARAPAASIWPSASAVSDCKRSVSDVHNPCSSARTSRVPRQQLQSAHRLARWNVRAATARAGKAGKPRWPRLRYNPGPCRPAPIRAGFAPLDACPPRKIRPMASASSRAWRSDSSISSSVVDRRLDPRPEHERVGGEPEAHRLAEPWPSSPPSVRPSSASRTASSACPVSHALMAPKRGGEPRIVSTVEAGVAIVAPPVVEAEALPGIGASDRAAAHEQERSPARVMRLKHEVGLA